ncbi:glutathione S-transferase family protein [Emcibacter sp. SYSU 3D8]|uniref:glutathione S-transferase family protein n=1 Tax=Emcibacter sp. SYSU 3D8 TaxID=3133969 RepID=UPI0031FEFD74
MALVLHYHPLSSFCHKVLIALYESGTAFEPVMVNLGDPAERTAYLEISPMGKIPALQDDGRAIVETSIQIEYLDQYHPGTRKLLPANAGRCLEARLWDRLFDLYIELPMQKIGADAMRTEGERDPRGVADARDGLNAAYPMIERQLSGKTWAVGDDFTIADCAAAPGLFYASILEPFAAYPNLSAYFERLLAWPSYDRVLREAQPFFEYYPYYRNMPERFRNWGL